MTGPTHRAMNVALTIGVAAATAVPFASAAAAAGVAYMMSTAPDRLEKLGFDHREQTHWPIVGFMLAAVAGTLVALGIASVAPDAAAQGLRSDYRTLTMDPLAAVTYVTAMGSSFTLSGWFAAYQVTLPATVFLGVLCGYVGHSLADSLTEGGVPLLGPISTRDMWLVPSWARIEVYTVVKDRHGNIIAKHPSRANELYRYAAFAATVAIVLTAYVPAGV